MNHAVSPSDFQLRLNPHGRKRVMTRWFLQVVAALVVLATPFAAQAEGPVHTLLRGHVIDPYAPMLRVVPPHGTTVMVSRNGKAAGWFSQPGVMHVAPNRTYTLTAIKGKYMIFNQSVVARHGTTEVVWSHGNKGPTISFQPTPVYAPVAAVVPAYPGGYGAMIAPASYHHAPSAHVPDTRAQGPLPAPKGKSLTARQLDRLADHMARMPTDSIRLSVLRPWMLRSVFTQAQSDALLATFRSDHAHRRAAAMLRSRTTG